MLSLWGNHVIRSLTQLVIKRGGCHLGKSGMNMDLESAFYSKKNLIMGSGFQPHLFYKGEQSRAQAFSDFVSQVLSEGLMNSLL